MGLLEVIFFEQEMNFRTVKKTIGTYGKIENNEWWDQKVNFGEKKKRTVRGQDFLAHCIIYIKCYRDRAHLVAATRLLYRKPSTLLADLTLPLVNPPTRQGQPNNFFLPSTRSRRMHRTSGTPDEALDNPLETRISKLIPSSDRRTHQGWNYNRTSGHLKLEILIGPLDTSKLKF